MIFLGFPIIFPGFPQFLRDPAPPIRAPSGPHRVGGLLHQRAHGRARGQGDVLHQSHVLASQGTSGKKKNNMRNLSNYTFIDIWLT